MDIKHDEEQTLNHSSNNALSKNLPTMWRLPPKLSVFTGRESQLSELIDAAKQHGQKMQIRPTKQITGTGGIGKTQLAVEFAHRAHDLKYFSTILWLNADCSVQDQLNIEFLQLASAFKINTMSLTKQMLIREVYLYLSQFDNILIIFDGASSATTLQPYLPLSENKTSIVITTRDDHVWDPQFKQIMVDIFSLEEAVEYINKVIPEKINNDQDAINLAIGLGRFPLGLAQATGYIKTRNISVEKYLILYREKAQTKRKILDTGQLAHDPHEETIWTTVNLCVESVTDELSQTLLSSTAYLAPEVPIHKHLFRHLAKSDPEYSEAIDLLGAYSLITNTKDQSSVRIHQLVQEVLQLSHDQEGLRSNLEHTGQQLEQFFIEEDQRPIEIETRRKALLPHLLTMLHHMEQHRQFSEPSMQIVSGPLDYSSGFCFELLGQYDKAIVYLESALKKYLEQGNALRASNAASILGTTLGRLGRFSDELKLLNIALDLKEKIFGANHPELAHIKHNLARNFMNQGRYTEAERLLSECLVVFEKTLSQHNPILATTMINLANLYAKLGDYKKQKELAQRALSIYTQGYNEDHPQLAITYAALAESCMELGELQDALVYFLRVININEREYGVDHLLTAIAKSNYATYLMRYSTDYQKVLDINLYVLSIFRKLPDPNDIRLSTCIVDLGKSYGLLGDYRSELVYLEQGLEMLKIKLSHNDPQICSVMKYIALHYHRGGLFSEELKILLQVRELLWSFYKTAHIDIAHICELLANCYIELSGFDSALQYTAEAYGICKECLGAQSEATITIHARLLEIQRYIQRQRLTTIMTKANVEVLGVRCMSYGFYRPALSFFSQGYSHTKNLTVLHEHMAICHLKLGDIDTARAILIDFPQSPIHQQITRECEDRELNEAKLLSFPENNECSGDFLMKKAELYLALRNISMAIESLNDLLKQDLDDELKAQAHFRLACCYVVCEEFSLARYNLHLSAKFKPNADLETLEKRVDETEEFYSRYCRTTKM